MPVYTPDDLMAGGGPTGGRVMLYDDDHNCMGSVLAEVLIVRGCTVDFVTPAVKVAEWSENTLEQPSNPIGVRCRGDDHLAHPR